MFTDRWKDNPSRSVARIRRFHFNRRFGPVWPDLWMAQYPCAHPDNLSRHLAVHMLAYSNHSRLGLIHKKITCDGWYSEGLTLYRVGATYISDGSSSIKASGGTAVFIEFYGVCTPMGALDVLYSVGTLSTYPTTRCYTRHQGTNMLCIDFSYGSIQSFSKCH